MNRLFASCLVALLACSTAACLQDFDQFQADPTSGQGASGGGTTGTSTTGSGGTTSTSTSTSTGTGGATGGTGGSGGATSTSSTTGGAGGTGGTGGSGPVCGDGNEDPDEACDDGNDVPGDGCSPACDVEDPDTCPGPSIPLTTAGLVITGDTTGAGNDAGALPCGGSQSGDFVYQIVPAQDGTLTATLEGNFMTHLYAHSECAGGVELECSSTHAPATVTLDVQAGQPIFLFVDGFGGQSQEGTFTLTLALE